MKAKTREGIALALLLTALGLAFGGLIFSVASKGPSICRSRVCKPSAWSDCSRSDERQVMVPIGDGAVMCACEEPPDDDDG